MRERPILFQGAMVRALLGGTKTQTRRIVKPQPNAGLGQMVHLGDAGWGWDDGDLSGLWTCPYGVPGDRLWVREAWKLATPLIGTGLWPFYRATAHDLDANAKGWKPSIHMRRAHCRLVLEVTEVRVQRLQDISEADALAEGVGEVHEGRMRREWENYLNPIEVCLSARASYRTLWDSINGAGSWDTNPWVWAVSFKRVTP